MSIVSTREPELANANPEEPVSTARASTGQAGALAASADAAARFTSDPSQVPWRAIVVTAASVVTALSASVLAGWVFGFDNLTRPLFGSAVMKPNTALVITLYGLALLTGATVRGAFEPGVVLPKPRRRVVDAAAIFGVIVGVLTLVEYVRGRGLGIDGILAGSDGLQPAGRTLRPSAPTAAMTICAGLALLTAYRKPSRALTVNQLTALGTVVLGYFAVLSHAYSANALLGLDLNTSMSFLAAMSFLTIGLCLFCLHPYQGWMRVLTSEMAGSFAARRLLPAAAVVFSVMGGLRVFGADAGLFDDRFGAALAATLGSALLIVAIMALAVIMNRQQHEWRVTEAERRWTASLLAGLIDASDSVIGIGDSEGRVLMMNKAFERYRGIPREEIIGRYGHEFLSAEESAVRDRMFERVMSTGRRVVDEVQVERPGMPTVYGVSEMYPIFGDAGEITAVASIGTDITDRRTRELKRQQLNEELEIESRQADEAIAELESFAHTVSHDLRSPLRAIDGFSQVLEAGYTNVIDERGRHHLEHIRAGVKEMNELISGLLEFSRIGRSEMKFSEVDMAAIAREANEVLAYEREGREVRVTIDELPAARADARLVGVVFANLLSNAHKYTRKRETAEITVGAEQAPGRPPVYFVRDNGIGFKSEEAEKLFVPFERLTGSGEFEGTGVGMTTVQRIIRRHGGRIWAIGKPDAGATIYFQLAPEEDVDA